MSYFLLDHPLSVEDREFAMPPPELRSREFTTKGREKRTPGHKEMQQCRFCQQQIAWTRLGDKPVPVDSYGHLHWCVKGNKR